jgi:hypothetical protein
MMFRFVAVLGAADAQIAVGAGVGQSTQEAGASDGPYLGPGFGGTSVASVIFVDAALKPTISLGGEVSLAGDITGSQFERVPGGSNALVSQHHDTVFSGVVKLRTPPSNRFQVAASGGLGLARRETNRVGTFVHSTPPFAPTPVVENLSDTVFAITGGLEVIIPIGSRLGILALVRAHYLADDDRMRDGVVHRGVSSQIYRYAIGAQVRF